MLDLTPRENTLVRKAIAYYLDDLRLSIRALTEPDERYERNDLQQDAAFLQSAYHKLEAAE